MEKTKTKKTISKEELDKRNVKKTIKKIITSEREIKYKYPEDLIGVLDRKAWRQRTRKKLENLELALARAKETGEEKAIKKANKEYQKYRKEVLLVP